MDATGNFAAYLGYLHYNYAPIIKMVT